MDIIEQLDRLRVRLDRDPRIAIVKQVPRSPRFPIEILNKSVPNERGDALG